MTHPAFMLDKWRAMTPDELLNRLQRLRKRRPSTTGKGMIWVNDGRLSPLQLYGYLKVRFGEPNGPSMPFKSPTVDNLIHWDYSIQSDGCLIELYGLSFRTEIHVYDSEGISPADWDDFVDNLSKDIAKHKRQIDELIRSFERWSVILNPYRRLDRIVRRQSGRVRKLDIRNIHSPKPPRTRKELDGYGDKLKKCWNVYHEGASLCMTLQFLTPVLGEAFVNLLIFVLARKELKSDRRLYEDFVRRNIDVRVKTLHLNCIGFEKPIDSSADAFKDFHSLMNRRNEVLHGNVDPKASKFDEIYYDHGNIPLFKREMSSSEFALQYALAQLEPDAVLRDVSTVRSFVEFVLDHLRPQVAEQIRMIMDQEELGWRPDTQRVGIIIPSVLAEFYMTTTDGKMVGED